MSWYWLCVCDCYFFTTVLCYPNSRITTILIAGQLYTNLVIAWTAGARRQACASYEFWQDVTVFSSLGPKCTCRWLYWRSLFDWSSSTRILFPLYGRPRWVLNVVLHLRLDTNFYPTFLNLIFFNWHVLAHTVVV